MRKLVRKQIGLIAVAVVAACSVVAQSTEAPQHVRLMQTKVATLLIKRTDAQTTAGMGAGEMTPVFFQVTIGTDGKVSTAVPLRDQNPIAIRAAEEALKDWRWHPVQYQGHPVLVDTIVAVHFNLDSHQAKPIAGWNPEGALVLEEDDAENLVSKKVNPTWPQGVSGTVKLMATVNERGTTENLAVVDAPSPEAGAAALAAVKQWRFHPLVVDTKAIAVDVPIVLKIKR